MIEFLTPKEIKKTWGQEIILINNDKFCGKYLMYDKKNNYSSDHLHRVKDEVFVTNNGSFNLTYRDIHGNLITKLVRKGDIIHIPPGTPHQLTALEDNSIMLEISTHDDSEDVVRISPSMP